MFYHGSHNPPPLPPRSPRPVKNVTPFPAGYPSRNYPPPPNRPASRDPGDTLGPKLPLIPPPIPPRPPGYEIRTSPSSMNGQLPPNFSIPPPPLGPPPSMAAPGTLPLGPRLDESRSNAAWSYSPRPSLAPGAATSEGLACHPPPPLGPPPQKTGFPNPYSQYSIPQYRPGPQSSSSSYKLQSSASISAPHSPARVPSRASLTVLHDSSALPAYSLLQVSGSQPPRRTPLSISQEDLATQFQSLTVENILTNHTEPTASHPSSPALYCNAQSL
ncbi:hypothetical protein F4821DRAFT_178386 [Hypoxylon rubiginosum]|uniref:Uncharacterized protein n=1 Tax=Hypoxylon rubiginosum TaxID=110542 RepID=A0ACC0CUJ6_9PEZI|nr:hypothetical protein F4821DRAFT_178386 [Hypoxylon rubiginosum]